MEKYIDEFLLAKKSHGLKETSLRSYKMWLKRLKDHGATIDDPKLGTFKSLLEIKYQPKNIQLGFNVIHNFYKFWNGEVKCFNHERIRTPMARANSHPAINFEEHQKIVAECKESDYRELQLKLVLSLLWDSGARIGEIVNIKTKQIELGQKSCAIDTEKTRLQRRIYWSEDTERLLSRYYMIRKEIERSEYLFLGLYSNGNYSRVLTSRGVMRRFRKICDRVGIRKNVVPHSYRHARIHKWFSDRLSPHEIILLSGHSSIVSLEHYMRLGNDEIEKMARHSLK